MNRQRGLRRVDVVPGPAGVEALLDLLPDALAGDGPALAVAPAGDDPAAARVRAAVRPDPATTVDDDIAVVLATSGSTGSPRGVLLPASALLASAEAALTTLVGGAAAWSLALPVTSVGGLQVLVRALMSSTAPEVLPSVGGASPFSPADFAAATWRLDPSLPGCTSIVPTQAAMLLDDPDGRAALQSYDAVLLGGARTPPELLVRLRAAHVVAVPTYGMTETSGGLVYDGMPLPGAAFRIDSPTGRIELSGPMLARGYLGDDAATATAFVDGWHRTEDSGRAVDGRLEVLGRLDDVVQVGGINVAVTAVEDVLGPLCGGAVVLAEPDDRWGARLTAYVVQPGPGSAVDDVEAMGAAVTAQLGRAAVPRGWVRLDAVPLLPNGKPDRAALREITRSGQTPPLTGAI